MKCFFKNLVVATVVCIAFSPALAQEEKPVVPKWSSDKGYWVTESSKQDPLTHTVRFYTNNDELIYKESLTGIRLNINKRKTKMKLKRALESAILAWEQNRTALEETALVKSFLQ